MVRKEKFCRLDPNWEYLPCQWDFRYNSAAREYYVPFFRVQYERSLTLGIAQAEADGKDRADAERRAETCRREFNAFLDRMLADPWQFERPTMLSIDCVRDNILRENGFFDVYYEIKHHDNELALSLLPEICRDLDAHAPSQQLQTATQGALAGNIFDMGVTATAQRMLEKSLSFLHTRDNLPRRPWVVDDFDTLLRRFLSGQVHRKAIMFVDNAGADFILGMLPLARFLALRGTEVVIAANELPTLNDMTIRDAQEIWPEVLVAEPSFGKLPIRLVSTGTGAPLIDLREISPELNREAANADLVILEGMGRALESNFFTRFDVDALKIAMIKEEFVAQSLGASMYDVVCRFEPAPRR